MYSLLMIIIIDYRYIKMIKDKNYCSPWGLRNNN